MTVDECRECPATCTEDRQLLTNNQLLCRLPVRRTDTGDCSWCLHVSCPWWRHHTVITTHHPPPHVTSTTTTTTCAPTLSGYTNISDVYGKQCKWSLLAHVVQATPWLHHHHWCTSSTYYTIVITIITTSPANVDGVVLYHINNHCNIS